MAVIGRHGRNYTLGKGGWSVPGGSASRIIGDRGATDPGGGKRVLGGRQPAWQQPVGDTRGSPWTPDVQAFPALGSHSSTKAGRRERPVSDNDGDVADGGTPKLPISTPEMDDPSRRMRPAGARRSSPPKPVVDLSDVREQAVGRPLSVEAPEFSPALDPRTRETGSVVLPSVDGTMAPVGFAGLSVPVVDGMEFSAVAELLLSDRSWNPRRSPGMVDRPMTNISAPEPLEHSILDEDLDGRPMEGLPIPEPLEHSALDEDLDSKPMEGLSVPEPLEHSVPNEDLDGRSMEGLSVPEPLEHSVLDEDLDGRPMEGRSGPELLEHSVLDVILERGSREELSALEPLEHSVPEVASGIRHIRGRIVLGPLEHSVPDLAPLRRTTPDPLEHSNLPSDEDGGRRLVPLEPLEHSVMGAPQDQRDVSSSYGELRVDTRSACLPRVFLDDRGVDVTPLDGRPEAAQTPPEAGDAIVVGAVGSAAPWFLTGGAHEVEVEFMIDTGCQVTILAMTKFEQMCTMDPMVRSRLRPCRHRLVLADSSPLTVKGELELNVIFPGLCCDMLFEVANIGSDGLLGTEALQSCLPHQLEHRTGQLWAAGRSTQQLHQQRLIPELDGFLMTSVVLPPDSEIVAPFSVSGVRP